MSSDLFYELWDLDTGNAVGEYRSLSDALDAIRDSLRRNGEQTLDGLGLMEVDAEGEGQLLASDRDLLPLIEART